MATVNSPGFNEDSLAGVEDAIELTNWAPDGNNILCFGNLRGRILQISRAGEVDTVIRPVGYRPFSARLDSLGHVGIWSNPVPGGERNLLLLTENPSQLIARGLDHGFSVDRENFYLSVAEYESDIWVMDLEW